MAHNQSVTGNQASTYNPPATEPVPSNQLPVALQTCLAKLAIEKAVFENQKLQQEIKKSETQTMAIQNPLLSTQSTFTNADKSHDTTGEAILPEVLTVSAKFGGLPQEKIAKI